MRVSRRQNLSHVSAGAFSNSYIYFIALRGLNTGLYQNGLETALDKDYAARKYSVMSSGGRDKSCDEELFLSLLFVARSRDTR